MNPIKITILLSVILFAVSSIMAQDTIQNRIVFDHLTQTKDSIETGSNALFHFPFTNISDTAFYFTKVRSSCGCLVPSWPREPIAPGDSGEIIGMYDSRRIGPINKTMYVELNDSDEIITLRIKGSVWPKE